jgi:hypothetical protein
MANDLLYKASLHLGASPQKKGAACVVNKVFLGLTTISRRQHVGDPDVNNPKVAIRNEQCKWARKSEIIGGGDSPRLSLA